MSEARECDRCGRVSTRCKPIDGLRVKDVNCDDWRAFYSCCADLKRKGKQRETDTQGDSPSHQSD